MATYAGRYDEVLLRKAGNRLAPPAANTTVLVYESNGSTVATLYTDRTKATTAANPVSVDASGNLEFFADPGTYVLAIRENGVQRAIDTAVVHLDPGDESEGLVDSVNGKTGAVTLVKGDVGLGNVDNTSDVNKPVSSAQQAALDAKAPLASPALTGTPTVPTAAPGTNTTQAASTAFVGTAVSNATSGLVSAQARRTAGNFPFTSTSWAALDGSLLDCVVPATAGDVLDISVSLLWNDEAVEGYLDVVTVVGATTVNHCSGAGAAGNGVAAWRGHSGIKVGAGGSILYTVVAGDLDAGQVRLRPVGKVSNVAGRAIFADATMPLVVNVRNITPTGS